MISRRRSDSGRKRHRSSGTRGRIVRRDTVAPAMRMARARLGLRQADLAEAWDVSDTTVSNYEREGAPDLVRYALLGLLVRRGVPTEEAQRITGL